MSGHRLLIYLILVMFSMGSLNCKGLKRSKKEDHTKESTEIANPSETNNLPRGLTVKTPLDESNQQPSCDQNASEQENRTAGDEETANNNNCAQIDS